MGETLNQKAEWDKRCPICKGPLKLVFTLQDGTEFWQCSQGHRKMTRYSWRTVVKHEKPVFMVKPEQVKTVKEVSEV